MRKCRTHVKIEQDILKRFRADRLFANRDDITSAKVPITADFLSESPLSPKRTGKPVEATFIPSRFPFVDKSDSYNYAVEVGFDCCHDSPGNVIGTIEMRAAPECMATPAVIGLGGT